MAASYPNDAAGDSNISVLLRFLRYSRPSGLLQRRIFTTVVVGLLPLAVLAFIVLLRTAKHQEQQLLESKEGAMRAVVAAVDTELAAAISSLDALAASPRLASDDYPALHGEAHELLSRRPSWANIVLSDAESHQLMNARLPAGSALPSGAYPDEIAQTSRNARPTIGNLIYSPLLEAHVFAVHVPVRKVERVSVLSAILRPEAIRQLLTDQHMPEQGVVEIIDRNYNIVARSLNDDGVVGKPASEKLKALLAAGTTAGWSPTSSPQGSSVYMVFFRSNRSGWTAAVEIPEGLVNASVVRSYWVFGALILGSVLLGIWAATLVSREITRPMGELKAAAQAIGRGTAPNTPRSDLPEIREVAAALMTAHAERESLLNVERQAKAAEHEARMAAERASRLKDEFLAMLAHELRNPLAAITSASLVLQASAGKPNSEKTIHNAVGIIRRQSRSLARLTDDLLDAARVVLGRIQLYTHPLELSALVQGAIDTLRDGGRLSDHHLTASLQPVWIEGDAIRIEQIVSNLLGNALKYTPPGGVIEIRTERLGNQVILRVRDSGVGIEPELLPRVFDLFIQGERSLDRSQGGLGIGLTMVRRLTELHGGAVQVVSAGRHKGSEFTITFPAIEPEQGSSRTTITEGTFTPRSIVILEDNADVRGSLCEMLRLAGHHVSVAADGKSGLDLILAEEPDVALIDVGLPLMDGLQVARALRSRPDARPVLLVAMSGYGTPDDIRNGFAAGFDQYLVKPVDEATLHDILRHAKPDDNVVSFSR